VFPWLIFAVCGSVTSVIDQMCKTKWLVNIHFRASLSRKRRVVVKAKVMVNYGIIMLESCGNIISAWKQNFIILFHEKNTTVLWEKSNIFAALEDADHWLTVRDMLSSNSIHVIFQRKSYHIISMETELYHLISKVKHNCIMRKLWYSCCIAICK
jgi:hypothetical protein